MDLKSTIENTNKYKNDLKLAKQKINDKIISGGGTIADTISDVPNAIDNMLKENYKKVAIMDTNINIADKSGNMDLSTCWGRRIPLNLSFDPSRLIFTIIHPGRENIITVDTSQKIKYDNRLMLNTRIYDYLWGYVEDVSRTGFTIYYNADNLAVHVIRITKIIAIE